MTSFLAQWNNWTAYQLLCWWLLRTVLSTSLMFWTTCIYSISMFCCHTYIYSNKTNIYVWPIVVDFTFARMVQVVMYTVLWSKPIFSSGKQTYCLMQVTSQFVFCLIDRLNVCKIKRHVLTQMFGKHKPSTWVITRICLLIP